MMNCLIIFSGILYQRYLWNMTPGSPMKKESCRLYIFNTWSNSQMHKPKESLIFSMDNVLGSQNFMFSNQKRANVEQLFLQ